MLGRVLPRSFYERPTLQVARDLIGQILVHVTRSGRLAGVIVEVEAYIGEDDPACHAAAGLTPRNAPLYGRPGRAYVYLNYGIHYLVNAVTEPEGAPAAVLLRAVEPVEGLDLMERLRRRSRRGAAGTVPRESLCRGPGNLSRAFGLSRAHNGVDLCGDRLFVETRRAAHLPVAWSPRVGIQVGVDRPWRCLVAGSPYVSAGSPARSRLGDAHLERESLARPGHAQRDGAADRGIG